MIIVIKAILGLPKPKLQSILLHWLLKPSWAWAFFVSLYKKSTQKLVVRIISCSQSMNTLRKGTLGMKQVWGDQPKLFPKVQSNSTMFKLAKDNWKVQKKEKRNEKISAKYKKRAEKWKKIQKKKI